jgi:sulfide:quinone oxidoreductase
MTFIATTPDQRLRVLIAGGGIAGLETLIALRALAGPRVVVTLISPQREFVAPTTTADHPPARPLVLADLAADHEAAFVRGALQSVDAAAKVATTDLGARLPFDVLVVAAGARVIEPLAGAVTFRGRADGRAMRMVVDDLRAGAIRSVAFALPRIFTWPVPLYELALRTSDALIGHAAELALITPEPEPLAIMGAAAGRAMRARLAQRGIALLTRSQPEGVELEGLRIADGSLVVADRVVTVPVLKGPGIRGLPSDSRGFLRVDRHGRVRGAEGVYAAGDVTDHPFKQPGLAARQADAVAEAIAAAAGAPVDPAPFAPVVRGLPEQRAGRYLAPYLASARPSCLHVTAEG